ncbi:MAG: hypothetical protein ACOVOW_02080 [Spirosomataceae bacterium]
MNLLTSKKQSLKTVVFLLLILVTHISFSQQVDSTKTPLYVGGAVNVTNNGVSLIPSFSLGKPAIMFDLVLGRKKLSFEPQMRFALEGKPWNFLFWWRYKLLKTSKWAVNLGTHPAVSFRERRYVVNGEAINVTVAQRVLASEFAPNYSIAKNVTVGVYYLFAHNFEVDATQNIHFLALRSNFPAIRLNQQFVAKVLPQIYYLNMDGVAGLYANANVTLSKKNCPITLSSILSKTIKADIAGKEFVWNLSLTYSFGKNYGEKK